MKPYLILSLLLLPFLFIPNQSHAVTRTAVNNGGWATASTWSPSGAPAVGDHLIIPAGKTVTVSSNITYNGVLTITVAGTLFFSGGGAKLKMACGSLVEILAGGVLYGNNNGNSQTITICNITYWSYGFDGTIHGPAAFPGTVMPVALLDFNVRSLPGQVLCEWSTATEQHCARFEVWAAQDPTQLTYAGSLAGQGDSNMRVDYTWVDPEPRTGLWFYQLRQVDHDGTTTHLGIRSVHVEPARAMVWPNPATDLLHIVTPNPGPTRVLDAAGQVVMTLSATEDRHVLQVGHLPQGTYYLRTANNGGQGLRFAIVR